MRTRLHAAAAQPHLGSLCDQHRRYAVDGRDYGVREDGEVAAFEKNACYFVAIRESACPSRVIPSIMLVSTTRFSDVPANTTMKTIAKERPANFFSRQKNTTAAISERNARVQPI